MTPILAQSEVEEAVKSYSNKTAEEIRAIQAKVRQVLGEPLLTMTPGVADPNFVRNVQEAQRRFGITDPDGRWDHLTESGYARWQRMQAGEPQAIPLRAPVAGRIETGRKKDEERMMARLDDISPRRSKPPEGELEAQRSLRAAQLVGTEFQMVAKATDAHHLLMTIADEMAKANSGKEGGETAARNIQTAVMALNADLVRLGFRSTLEIPSSPKDWGTLQRQLKENVYPVLAMVLVQALDQGKLESITFRDKVTKEVGSVRVADFAREDLQQVRGELASAAVRAGQAAAWAQRLVVGSPLIAVLENLGKAPAQEGGEAVAGAPAKQPKTVTKGWKAAKAAESAAPAPVAQAPKPAPVPTDSSRSPEEMPERAPPAPPQAGPVRLPPEVKSGEGTKRNPYHLFAQKTTGSRPYEFPLILQIEGVGAIYVTCYVTSKQLENLNPENRAVRQGALAQWNSLAEQIIRYRASRNGAQVDDEAIRNAQKNLYSAIDKAIAQLRSAGAELAGY